MGSIRALALCALVALLAAACVVADHNDWQTVTSFVEEGADQPPVVEAPAPHTGVILASDPFAYDGGLERAASDEEIAAAFNAAASSSAPRVRANPAQPGKAPAKAPSTPATANPCQARKGTCKEARTGCTNGVFQAGLCPGMSLTTSCCLPKAPTPGPARTNTPAAPAQPPSACTAEGGLCKEPSAGCNGKFKSGLCPGATAKCCMPPALAPCPAAGGSCKEPSAGCAGGTFASGLCPGTGKCCLPAGSACIANKGTCKEKATGCAGGQWYSGMCPGTATCCIPNSAIPAGSQHCGIYATSPKSQMEGNDGIVYTVVKVAKAHLSDPGMYNNSPTQSDNTISFSTACAFNVLRSFAAKAGHTITINSAFRTYTRQVYFRNCYETCSCNDCNEAAPPGLSNHGTGCAVDLNLSDAAYGWMAANAHKHGFIRTVPSETWHWEHRPGYARAPYT